MQSAQLKQMILLRKTTKIWI